MNYPKINMAEVLEREDDDRATCDALSAMSDEELDLMASEINGEI